MARIDSRESLEALRNSINSSRDPSKPQVTVCGGTGCHAGGCTAVAESLREEMEKQGLADKVEMKTTGCHGFCERGPIVVIQPQDIFYQQVKVKDVPQIVSQTVAKGEVINKLLYSDPVTGQKVTDEKEVNFYKRQERLLLGNNRLINPESIEDYFAVGGYTGLAKALLKMTPDEIVQEVKTSGLRGRGGGGFPTGTKWETTKHAHGDIKYVICNADEGDPGAYMDRSLIEGNPHSVIEGMIIGAYAIGSHEGYIYIRNEYPLAVKNVKIAIEQAHAYGLLGKNILGSGFDFDIEINRGGGAFVCGESTALMASLEGKPGEPRAKYVHTAEKGLWDRPTNLNNVETWSNIPLIINNSGDWYSKIGTERSTGTKIFSLVGKINNTGLVEVPMGTTLREIVYDIGGGIPKNRKFKAVQTGGPSGGFIPDSLIDLPVGFDELTKVGSMMGSGAMIVMDEKTCMVDMAKYFLTFLEEESCGKCVPCREGVKRMRSILERISDGEGKIEDLDQLEFYSEVLSNGSLCALGGSAPNPVLTSIRYFRDEYIAHIEEKQCPAGVCKPLINYYITDKCPSCKLCSRACPSEAITVMGPRIPSILDQEKCIKCGSCYDVCPVDAVEVR